MTLIPSYLSKQGLLGEVDWRQRLTNGVYSIKMIGIDEQQPNLFPSYPYGAGDQRLRGSIETKGSFFLNQDWQFGWNATWLSDKFFANDYKLQGIDFSNYYFQDVVSSVYLRGQADHSFFDLSAYHFEGTTANDENRTLPIAAPVLDYNRVFDVPADRTDGIGGQATIDVNVANIDRTNAAFQSTGLQTFDNAYHLYNVCETAVGEKYVNTYYPGACMLRGIAGDYTRASGQLSWQRSYIDSIGEVWKPFAFARLDGEATELNNTGSITYASAHRNEHCRQFEPGRLLFKLGPGGLRAWHGGRGTRIPLSFYLVVVVGHADDHPDRAVHRSAQRGHSEHPAERRRPEPRFRRYEPVRMEQVLRIRPDRGRNPVQLRVPVHGEFRQRRARQCGRRAVDPGRRTELLYSLRRRQRRPGFRPQQDVLQLRRRRDASADLGPDLVHQQAAVRQFDLPA